MGNLGGGYCAVADWEGQELGVELVVGVWLPAVARGYLYTADAGEGEPDRLGAARGAKPGLMPSAGSSPWRA